MGEVVLLGWNNNFGTQPGVVIATRVVGRLTHDFQQQLQIPRRRVTENVQLCRSIDPTQPERSNPSLNVSVTAQQSAAPPVCAHCWNFSCSSGSKERSSARERLPQTIEGWRFALRKSWRGEQFQQLRLHKASSAATYSSCP